MFGPASWPDEVLREPAKYGLAEYETETAVKGALARVGLKPRQR
jgi:hypothetical protein